MDTQGNLVVKKTMSEYIDVYREQEEILFEFNEFEKVVVQNNYANTIFKFETPSLDEMYVLKPGEELILNDFEFSRNDYENNTFYPEKYIVEIHCGASAVKTLYFLVKSNGLGCKTDNIRRIVSDFSRGLELDLKSKQRGKVSYDSSKTVSLPVCERIVNHARSLKVELALILNNPIINLEKQMIKTSKQMHVSKKKIIKDARKGVSDTVTNKQFYEKKVMTYDHPANVILKKSMRKIVYACDCLENYFISNLKRLEINEQKASVALEKARTKLEDSDIERLSSRYLISIKSTYSQRKEVLERIQNEYHDLQNNQLLIKSIRKLFLESMNEGWLSKISTSSAIIFNKEAYSNIHYRNIINFANSIDSKLKHDDSKLRAFPYRKTSELYEYYVLILIFKILFAADFEMEFESVLDMNAIFDHEEFVFKNGDKKIRILYNPLIKSTDDLPSDEIVNQNSNSNRPDIIVMIYDKEQFITSFILEVKCRRRYNIFNKNGDTPVFSQLKDYTNFWYFDENLNLIRDPIEMVYAIYPDQEARREYYNANQICLLSLEPEYDYEQCESFLLLKEEILSYVQ